MPNTSQMSQRRYGVELEFTGISQTAAAAAVRNAGVPCQSQGYNHRTSQVWKVVTDASCGLEIVSPILQGTEGLEQIRKVCDALTEAGATVNRKCGYHLHIDCADFDLSQFKNLAKLWVKFEDVFDALQPPSRRRNQNYYCQSNRLSTNPSERFEDCTESFNRINQSRNFDSLSNLFGNRYRKLNFQAYFRHRTIEVRHHAGTLNAEKAVNWVLLMMSVFEDAKTARTIRPIPQNSQTGAARLKYLFQRTTPANVRRFYSKRARELAAA